MRQKAETSATPRPLLPVTAPQRSGARRSYKRKPSHHTALCLIALASSNSPVGFLAGPHCTRDGDALRLADCSGVRKRTAPQSLQSFSSHHLDWVQSSCETHLFAPSAPVLCVPAAVGGGTAQRVRQRCLCFFFFPFFFLSASPNTKGRPAQCRTVAVHTGTGRQAHRPPAAHRPLRPPCLLPLTCTCVLLRLSTSHGSVAGNARRRMNCGSLLVCLSVCSPLHSTRRCRCRCPPRDAPRPSLTRSAAQSHCRCTRSLLAHPRARVSDTTNDQHSSTATRRHAINGRRVARRSD